MLRPGGRFVFVEHVAAPDGTGLRRLQTGAAPAVGLGRRRLPARPRHRARGPRGRGSRRSRSSGSARRWGSPRLTSRASPQRRRWASADPRAERASARGPADVYPAPTPPPRPMEASPSPTTTSARTTARRCTTSAGPQDDGLLLRRGRPGAPQAHPVAPARRGDGEVLRLRLAHPAGSWTARRSWTWAVGPGRDAFVAAALAGPAGRVIGVDMTEAQIEVARRHRQPRSPRPSATPSPRPSSCSARWRTWARWTSRTPRSTS